MIRTVDQYELAPVKPAASYIIAAYNAPAKWKWYADKVCRGESILNGTLVNGTGVATESGQTLVVGGVSRSFHVTTPGSFTVNIAAGQTAIATALEFGTASIEGGDTAVISSGGTFTRLVYYNIVTLGAVGTLHINMPVGMTAVVSSGTTAVTGSPVSCPQGVSTAITTTGAPGTIVVTLTAAPVALAAGVNVINTAITGVIYVSGMNDDTNDIKPIIDICVDGDLILFSPGDFMFGVGLTVNDLELQIRGCGIESTRWKQANNLKAMITYTGTGHYYCPSIRDIEMEGQNGSMTVGSCISSPGNFVNDLRLTDLAIMHFAEHGVIAPTYSWGFVLDKCILEFNKGYGARVAGNTKIISSKFAANTVATDIPMLHIDNLCQVIGNEFTGFAATGGDCDLILVQAGMNIVNGNTFKNVSGNRACVSVRNSYNVVTNNTFSNCSCGYGLKESNGVSHGVYAGNTFYLFTGWYEILLGLNSASVAKNNGDYILPGEIRTFSGLITNLAQNAYNSVDNPFGQSVKVLDLQIDVNTGATATAPNLDCGLGNSATTDYTNLFDDLPGETIGYYKSTVAVPGMQTLPLLWQSGAGNRYLNMSIKDAAATGMVARYIVTVMGM